MKSCIIGLLHFRRTCSHVSFSFELQISQLGLGYLVGQKSFLRVLPMYCHVLNLRSCLIFASVICGLVQNVLESSLSILRSFLHLLIYGNFSSRYSKRNMLLHLVRYFL